MTAYPTPTSVLLLIALALPPRPSLPPSATGILSTLSWPLSLVLNPPTSPLFTRLPASSLRSISIARAVEEYALAWAFLGLLNASVRIVSRIKQRIRPVATASAGDNSSSSRVKGGLRTKAILGVRPILTAAVWHLLAWRLVVLPSPLTPKTSSALDWPLDPSTVIGVVGGAIASAGEIGRILGLFGWNKDPQTGPSWTLATTHILLTLHRLSLATRILRSGMSGTATGFIKA